jgi:hypothetical protein
MMENVSSTLAFDEQREFSPWGPPMVGKDVFVLLAEVLMGLISFIIKHNRKSVPSFCFIKKRTRT